MKEIVDIYGESIIHIGAVCVVFSILGSCFFMYRETIFKIFETFLG